MADIQAGRALWEAGIDRSKVASDAAAVNADIAAEGAKGEAAATASATSTLAKVSSLSRAAASTVALGAGAMFGVATKLASEGEDAMAKFQAQTGATADEAKTAFESMNRLSGENLQSFGKVSDTFTEVTKNLGVTGQAAEDATNAILKFSTATGTDAVANVGAFDDVLDSWGKSAADLPGIMDMVIASTQKFGGNATDATAALSSMAPALRGMGASMEDGIGLIDLFAASGVDASGAAAGLNKALKNLKPGQDLDDLIAQIGAIEDPTLRSQKAIEIFGKSGATLGNAIQPGMKSLDDFKISMGDAKGAATDAADAIESTLPNQIKKGVDGALAQARGFATDFGPALMGVSSLASIGTSIASALHLDDAIGGALKKALGSSVVQSAITSLGSGLAGKLSFIIGGGLAAGLVFNELMETINKQLGIIPDDIDKAVHEAYQTALAGGPYVAHAFADTYQSSLDAGLSKPDAYAAALQAEKDALTKAATLWSQVTKHLIQDPFMHDTSFGQVGEKVGNDIGEGIGRGANEVPWQAEFGRSLEHDTSFRKIGETAATQTSEGFDNGMEAYHHHLDWISNLGGRGGPGDVAFHTVGVDNSKSWTQGFDSGWGAMAAAGKAGGYKAAGAVATGFGLGLRAAKGDAEAAWTDYLDALNHPMRGANLLAFTLGKLHGPQLARGLRSGEPAVHDAALAERDSLINTLEDLKAHGYTIGQAVPRMLAQGMTRNQIRVVLSAEGLSKAAIDELLNGADGARGAGGKHSDRFAAGVGGGKGKAKTAAGTVVDSAKSGFDNTAGVYQYGVDLVDRYAAGMARAGINAATIAEGIVARVGGVFMDDVPIPADAPEHIRRIGEYGGHFIDRWIGGMWSQGDAAARSAEMLGLRVAGSLTGGLGPMQHLTGGGAVVRHEGTVRHEVRLTGDTIAAARAQGASWDDVGRIARSANGLASGLQMRLSVNG